MEKKKKDDGFVFGDPDSYKDMPMDERKALTKKMMGAHRTWAHSPISPKLRNAPGRTKWS